MFNFAINTVSTISKFEAILQDCLNDTGFPPLTDFIAYLRSDSGKQLIANVITFVRTVVLIVAFLAIASVMGIAIVSQKIGEWAWGLFIEKFAHALTEHQMFETFMVPANKAVRTVRAVAYLTKRELRRLWREAMASAAATARRMVTALDNASGVAQPTF